MASGVAVQLVWRLLGLEIGKTDRCAVCWYTHFFCEKKSDYISSQFSARGELCLNTRQIDS